MSIANPDPGLASPIRGLTSAKAWPSPRVWAPADDETPIGVGGELAERHHPLLEFATLAGHRDPFDPMEQAIVDLTRVSVWPTPSTCIPIGSSSASILSHPT